MQKTINTMEEFAAYAGVSRPTASKYFEQADSVSARSRGKIEAALARVNYRPNLLASSLMRKDSRIIGVLIPSFGDPFYASIVQSLEMFALNHGYLVMAVCSYGKPELEDKALAHFVSIKASGICFAPAGYREKTEQLSRIEQEIPVVFIDAVFEGASHTVRNNNQQSIALITHYVLDSGRTPSYFPMPTVNSNADERNRAFVQIMQAQKLTPNVLPVDTHADTWAFEEWAKQQMLLMIKSKQLHTDAIICANDRIAFGVLSALSSVDMLHKTADGYNIAVCGHDNHPLSGFTVPPLTTVEQNVTAIGQTAIEIILAELGKTPAKHSNETYLDSKLILRESA
ncbi:MAG: LacI family DNA-binding transcriptional regulator [Pontibacterium sp.]